MAITLIKTLLRCRAYSGGSCQNIRNIGIIAHIDAGKTTTTERMLFYSGVIRRIGDVDRGDTVMDYLPEERERGITITAAAITFNWGGHRINLIDTPGHVDFGMEVERSLRVVDGAITILDASAGVQAQTRTVWKQASKFDIPRIFYINKMDKIGADFDKCVRDVREKFSDIIPLCLQIPISKNDKLEGIADLINRRVMYWRDQVGKDIDTIPWLDEYFEKRRSDLVEELASLDDELLEMYLNDISKVNNDILYKVIRKLTISRKIAPVLCGSSLSNIGIQPLLDSINQYLPNPSERPLPNVRLPGGKIQQWSEKSQSLLALAFKVVYDEQRGLMVFVRVYNGVLTNKFTLRNTSNGTKERVTRVLRVLADKVEEVEEVEAGNVAVLLGLRNTKTGDTLMIESEAKHGSFQLLGIHAPQEPVFTCSVEAERASDEAEIEKALKIIELEDPSIKVKCDPETGQKHISGMGELHLEVVGRRIVNDLKANAAFGQVEIAFKETVSEIISDQISDTLDKEVFGRRMVGGLSLKISSDPNLQGNIEFVDNPSQRELKEAITEGLQSALQEGKLAGFPIIGLNIDVTSIQWMESLSTPEAFRYISHSLLRKWIHQQATVRLLEPVMSVEIMVPDQHVGPILTDIHSGRRGIVNEVTTSSDNKEHSISAEIPLASMLGYANFIRSVTSGTGTFAMNPLRYRMMPKDDEGRVLSKMGIVIDNLQNNKIQEMY